MEYVSRVTLELNGLIITDFKKVTEKEFEVHRAVNLMTKTGAIKVTSRYGVDVDYAIPKNEAAVDWASVADARLTIDYENGRRTTYTGVYTGKVGAISYDSENEAVCTVELLAIERIAE